MTTANHTEMNAKTQQQQRKKH